MDERNIRFKKEIQKIFTEHKGYHGVHCVSQELLNRGFVVNINLILREKSVTYHLS